MKSGIEKNLMKLMETFEKAGINLTESQKAEIRRNVLALEPTDSAREARYRGIFETLQHNLEVRNELNSKIREAQFAAKERQYQTAIENMKKTFEENKELLVKAEREKAKKQLNEAVEVERQKVAEAVDKYLDEYLEKVIPEQKLVDYKRLNELETLVESMKDTLAFSNKDVEERVSSIKRGYEDKLQKVQEISAAKTKALNEAQEKINEEKAKQYVIRRTRDLPALEAKLIREKFAGYKSIQQVRENFSKVLNEVEDQLAGNDSTEKIDGLNTKMNNLDSKVNSLDSKVNDVDSTVNDLDSKIDQLVDTSMGNGGNAGGDVASGDAGAEEGDLGSETSDDSANAGMEGAPVDGAPATGSAPDFGAMTDDEINAHEFGTDEEDAEVPEDGETAVEEPAQQAQPAAQPAQPEQPQQAPQQQPVAEDFVIDGDLMNRLISECIHITP